MAFIKRTKEAALMQWRDEPSRKPLILRGARQTGKTSLIKEFGQKNFKKLHYINFEKQTSAHAVFEENLSPGTLLQKLAFILNSDIDIKEDLLVFDEIQACPRAITSLKYFSEEEPQLALIAAGSLLGLELSNFSFPVGKVTFLDLAPMSFGEFLLGIQDLRALDFLESLTLQSNIPQIIHAHLWEQWKKYTVVGGLPEIVMTFSNHQQNLFDAMQKVRARQNDLIQSYIADMAKHSGKVNAMHLERLWRNVPEQLAREADSSTSKFRFKEVVPGVRSYLSLQGAIDWLEKAGLIIRVPIAHKAAIPLSAYTKENMFKLYCFDVGILGALSDLPAKTLLDYNYGSYQGYIAENFVAQEFLALDINSIYAWREGRAEIEFLREINTELIPIEVKSGRVTQAKSLAVFAGKYNPSYQVVLSARTLQVSSDNKKRLYPIYAAGKLLCGIS